MKPPVVDVHPSLKEQQFYHRALKILQAQRVPFLVGGAYAYAFYTGVQRHTKDLDVFIKPADYRRALQVMAQAGYETEATAPRWLGKAFHKGFFVDFILGFANGIGQVEDSWWKRAPRGESFGVPVQFVAPEEMIWMKAFVQARDRYDGADVAHLLKACGESMDWKHLLRRFGLDWRVLFSHLVLFGFIYPGERHAIPATVMDPLMLRLKRELGPTSLKRLCRGTLLTHTEYKKDIEQGHYKDARAPQHRKNLEAPSR